MPRFGHITRRLLDDFKLLARLLLILLLSFYLYRMYQEAGSIMVLSILVIIAWQARPRWFEPIKRNFDLLARRRLASVVVAGFVALFLSVGLSLRGEMPQPRIHDEFSFLLAADTFLQGRLTNPTHPMWVHFETMHVIYQPSYASKYPPAQGIVLALGMVIGGQAIVGVWLSVACSCAAVCWMLIQWLGPRWGLLGGLITGLHPLFLEWSQSYWGGAVAMAGGALLLGGFRRIVRCPRSRDAYIMGLGLVILAFSRPYEGCVLSGLIIATLLALRFMRPRRLTVNEWAKRVVLPLVAIGALTVLGWGFYNVRVTGQVLKMPFAIHEATYAVAQPFLWQRSNPEPTYNHKEIRDFQVDWSLRPYLAQQSLEGFVSGALEKLVIYSESYFQGWVGLLMIGVCYVRRDRWVRIMALVLIVFTMALLAATWARPPYAAPAAGLALLLFLSIFRRLQYWKIGGVAIGQTITRVCLILFIASILSTSLNLPPVSDRSWSFERARLLARLEREPGKHLVIVHYDPQHNFHEEWVYNEADIDQAKVVWARNMSPDRNRELIDYFGDRRVWILKPDSDHGNRLRSASGNERATRVEVLE